jgi:hypothetical protein
VADRIESHRARFPFGFQSLHHCVFVWALLPHYSKGSIAIGREYQFLFDIVDRCIRLYADGNLGDLLSCVCIGNNHELVVAHRKETSPLSVHSQPRRAFARC